jgi:hypothetical protein
MTMPIFSGDQDKDEINPREWLTMINKNYLKPFITTTFLTSEAFN